MEQKTLIGNGFTGNQLKIFAIIAMTIDHLTSVIIPGYEKTWWIILLHIIGRLAAPTMWFMIVEGYRHTKNLKGYITRLFVFSIISHFAYNFCFGIPFIPFETTLLNQTSVIWPLAWGVVALYIHDEERCKLKAWQKLLITIGICLITFPSDWSCIAVLAIIDINKYYGNLKKQVCSMLVYVAFYATVYAIFVDVVYGLIQMLVIICVPFIMNYNGKRGNWKGMKWFFYVFYVGHLVICGIIRILLHGNIGVIIGG
ncbi:MAG: conjugal transfer protein TraX [Clostridia bacterium]|nr:conjugal transfer protein TraX [Clostridia bacterium]